MSGVKSKTAAEVLPDQGSGTETENDLPLFPTPAEEQAQAPSDAEALWRRYSAVRVWRGGHE